MRRCTGGADLPGAGGRAPEAFRLARAFDIEGLGEKQIEEFYDDGLVMEPADIFTLQKRDARVDEQARRSAKATARPRCAICSPRSTRAARSRSTA